MIRLLATSTILLAWSGSLAGAEVISGTIQDQAGKPIADSEVFLIELGGRGFSAVATTKSKSDGSFALPLESSRAQLYRVVVVHKPGLSVGAAALRFNEPLEMLQLRLLPVAEFAIEVLTPTGEPLQEGRAWVSQAQLGGSSALMDALAERFAAKIDDRGRVLFGYLPANCEFTATIETKAFGKQVTRMLTNKPGQTLQLQPVGRLVGRVFADDPAAVKNLALQVFSSPHGRAEARTDEAGRFEVAALAAGQATVQITVDERLPFRAPTSPERFDVKPGETTNIELRLQRGVLVSGTVVDAQTNQPIEGVELQVGGQTVKSDREGKYQAVVAPGPLTFNLARAPGSYMSNRLDLHLQRIEPGVTTKEFPPYRLTKGREISGTVVDENDRPVAGAFVVALWRASNGQLSTLGNASARSGADGRFTLKPVLPDVQLGITARTEGRATAKMMQVPPGETQHVPVKIVPGAVVALEGRVVDPEGKPVRNAAVEFWITHRIPTGQVYGSGIYMFGGTRRLLTDADGRYRTPTKVPRDDQYVVNVSADGMLAYKSEYLTLNLEGDLIRLPDVTLQRETSLAGVVVDSAGKPIPQATVSSHGHGRSGSGQRVQATTTAEGSFRLAQVHPRARLVFAEAKGYRRGGAAVVKRGEPIRIVLERADAPSALPPLRSIRRTDQEKGRLLAELLDPILPQLFHPDREYFVTEAFNRLAPFDSERCLRILERTKAETARARMLVLLGETDEAMAILGQVESGYSRVYGLFNIIDRTEDRARKQELLSEALVHARTIEKADQRVVIMAKIAEALYDAGARDAAAKILTEAKPIAVQLAPSDRSGFSRSLFAETLALFEPAAAMEMIAALADPNDQARHAGNIAHELADVNPAEAERALGLIKSDNRITPYPVRVCYRMAKVDLPRARRIADVADRNASRRSPASAAHAYGVMAMAHFEKDPAAAKQMLADAFARLTPANARMDDSYAYSVGVALLGFAEVVDPDRTREYFWRTLALHRGPDNESWPSSDKVRYADQNSTTLVVVLGLFDQFPELRAELMEPVFQHWAGFTNRKEFPFNHQSAIFTAMALTDPERTIRWHTSFHAKVEPEDLRLIPQPWMTIADAFGNDGADLQRVVSEEVFHLWVIDKEDL